MDTLPKLTTRQRLHLLARLFSTRLLIAFSLMVLAVALHLQNAPIGNATFANGMAILAILMLSKLHITKWIGLVVILGIASYGIYALNDGQVVIFALVLFVVLLIIAVWSKVK